MDALEKVEISIDKLLVRLNTLKEENARLRAEIFAIAQDKEALNQENQKLRASLIREKFARSEAIKRIDLILAKIEGRDCA